MALSALETVRRSLADVNASIKNLNSRVGDRAGLSGAESDSYLALRKERSILEAREVELVEADARMSAIAATRAQLTPAGSIFTSETLPYDPSRPTGTSFFSDIFAARTREDRGALDRLERAARANDQINARAGLVSNVSGSGGVFDPPAWLIDSYVKFARPGRPTADVCSVQALPSGVSSINLPRVTAGTTTASVGTQNTAVSNTDPTTDSLSSTVQTIAGYNLVSQAFIDQTPLANIDEIVLADLAASISQNLDAQVLNGTGSSGQLSGILGVSGTSSVTYTSATPALMGTGALFSKVVNAIGNVAANRYAPATHVIMHPSRWAQFVAATDTTNRPLVVPTGSDSSQGVNAVGTALASNGAVAQGIAGHIAGLPVILDAQIPTTLGAGTNQDVIIIARMSDLMLWESAPQLVTMNQPYANQLSVLVRAHQYFAFIGNRYPKSIATVGGTGLVFPPSY